MKHLLGIEHLTAKEISDLVLLAASLKEKRGIHQPLPLSGQTWAMIFAKSSTRTRVSFEVGIHELGGRPMFLNANDIQLGRGEPIKDTARVLGRMVHGCIIRTFDQQDIVDFAEFGNIPTVNALTDEEHPCQLLADLQTIRERLGTWEGKRIAFFGDGDCNMGRSWAWAAKRLEFDLVICSPPEFQPGAEFLERLDSGHVTVTDDPEFAARKSDVLYTDTWISMGKEDEAEDRLRILAPYQITHALLELANDGAIVQHCLPAYRDKEISGSLMEERAEEIFDQAENRLHAQKAVLVRLAYTDLRAGDGGDS